MATNTCQYAPIPIPTHPAPSILTSGPIAVKHAISTTSWLWICLGTLYRLPSDRMRVNFPQTNSNGNNECVNNSDNSQGQSSLCSAAVPWEDAGKAHRAKRRCRRAAGGQEGLRRRAGPTSGHRRTTTTTTTGMRLRISMEGLTAHRIRPNFWLSDPHDHCHCPPPTPSNIGLPRAPQLTYAPQIRASPILWVGDHEYVVGFSSWCHACHTPPQHADAHPFCPISPTAVVPGLQQPHHLQY